MASITLRPTSATASSWSSIANAYDTSTSTSATVSIKRSNYSSRTATFNFDTSSIPSGATINSATLYVNAKANTASRITMYADINGSSSSRVINSSLSTSAANYTADVKSYMSSLSTIMLTGYMTSNTSTTFTLYDVRIEVDYTETPKYNTLIVNANENWGYVVETNTNQTYNFTNKTLTIQRNASENINITVYANNGYLIESWTGGGFGNTTTVNESSFTYAQSSLYDNEQSNTITVAYKKSEHTLTITSNQDWGYIYDNESGEEYTGKTITLTAPTSKAEPFDLMAYPNSGYYISQYTDLEGVTHTGNFDYAILSIEGAGSTAQNFTASITYAEEPSGELVEKTEALRPISVTQDSEYNNTWTNPANTYDTDTSTSGTIIVTGSSQSGFKRKYVDTVFNFDTSHIPADATINSATLTIRAKQSATTNLNMTASINGNDVIASTLLSSSSANYTADVKDYVKGLGQLNVNLTSAATSNRTFTLYDVRIDLNYSVYEQPNQPEEPDDQWTLTIEQNAGGYVLDKNTGTKYTGNASITQTDGSTINIGVYANDGYYIKSTMDSMWGDETIYGTDVIKLEDIEFYMGSDITYIITYEKLQTEEPEPGETITESKLNIGGTLIDTLYIGGQAIEKIYIGNTLIFGKGNGSGGSSTGGKTKSFTLSNSASSQPTAGAWTFEDELGLIIGNDYDFTVDNTTYTETCYDDGIAKGLSIDNDNVAHVYEDLKISSDGSYDRNQEGYFTVVFPESKPTSTIFSITGNFEGESGGSTPETPSGGSGENQELTNAIADLDIEDNSDSEINETISWTAPNIPSNATVTSYILAGTVASESFTTFLSINNNTILSEDDGIGNWDGQTFSIDLGKDPTVSSANVYIQQNGRTATSVYFTNMSYTITYTV